MRLLVLMLLANRCFGLTVHEIPDLIRGNNPEVQATRKETEANESGVWTARARHLPTLNLKNSFIHLGDDITLKLPTQHLPLGPTILSLDLPPLTLQRRDVLISNLVLTVPLFAGGRISAGVDAAKAQVREARATETKVSEDKIAEALERYFSVQLARQVTSILEKTQDDLERIRKISEGLVKSGLGAKFYIWQVKVAQADLSSRLFEARGKAQLADLAFRTTTGKDGASELAYDSSLIKLPTPAHSEPFKVAALKQRSELQILGAKSEQVSALKSAHTGEMLPSLYALGVRRVYAHNVPVLEPQWAVGVVLDIPLTGWLTASGEREKAIRTGDRVELLQRQALNEIPLQIEKLFVEVTAADAALAASREALEASRETLRLAEVRFKSGDGSALEVLRAATDLEKIEIQGVMLTEAFNRKLIELHKASGNVQGYLEAYAAGGNG